MKLCSNTVKSQRNLKPQMVDGKASFHHFQNNRTIRAPGINCSRDATNNTRFLPSHPLEQMVQSIRKQLYQLSLAGSTAPVY